MKISEKKYNSINVLQRMVVPAMLKFTFELQGNKTFLEWVEFLEKYLKEQSQLYDNVGTADRRIAKILHDIPRQFEDLDTRQYYVTIAALWEHMQDNFDVGQDNEKLRYVVQQIIDVFEQGTQLMQEEYVEDVNVKATKVLEYLQSKELFIYSNVTFITQED